MYLGMNRSWWMVVGALLAVGLVLLVGGDGVWAKVVGGLALVAGIGVFAAAPTGAESKRRKAMRERERAAAAAVAAPPTPAARPTAPPPPTRPFDASNPSDV